MRLAVVVFAVLLAVLVVTGVTVDLGPALRRVAEQQGSNYMHRPMHIGRLSVHLWRGIFVIENLTIEGLTPEGRPFLTAKRIALSMPWSTLFNRRVVFDSVEMSDWRMYGEVLPGGKHNFPKFTPDGPRGPSRWTTTMQYLRAYRGEFTFEDHGAPWSTVARNLEVIVARPHMEYRGQAKFSDGTVTIQNFVPMHADLKTAFKIEGGLVTFDTIDLVTDGAHSTLTGSADVAHFPEMTYQIQSHIQLPRMREIFFARDTFSLYGEADFTGSWHLFKGGRELKGRFTAPVLGVNDYRFGGVRGALLWLPERFEVTDGTGKLYGGAARFTFGWGPFGDPLLPATARFDTSYRDVDLTSYTDFLRTPGLRLAGRISGHNLLEWPQGRFADHRGEGDARAEPPAGQGLMTRQIPAEAIEQGERENAAPGPFSKHTPLQPVPVGGEVRYSYGPDWVNVAPSRVATPDTLVEFEGRTAWGDQSQLPFHVTSADWQASDRLFAGLLTAFGSPTQAIEIGGHGVFDGVMTESFRRPRIEGDFAGEGMRAWHAVWGQVLGHAVIENSYADVRNVVIRSGDSTINADGKFSLGYPRKDGGEEINARVRVTGRPVPDLRAAFNLYDYPVDGLLSGEFHLFGAYEHPYGFGLMSIEHGTAYREPFDLGTASLRFEGTGVRLDGIEVRKGSGRGIGAAYVGFDGAYSFNFDGRRVPVEEVSATRMANAPELSGFLDFTAAGSGAFETPTYDVKASISDVFVADEGVGRMSGDLSLRGKVLTMKLEAASPRLAVSGAGRIDTTEGMNADLSFQISDTSLDPYVRVLQPDLLPFTTAIASGRVRVTGDLTNLDRLRIDGQVDTLDLSFFDYRLRNSAPIRIALDGPNVRVTDMRLAGDDTELDITGVVNLNDQRIAARASGTANLGIIQGFVRDVRGSGRASVAATIEGPISNPVVNGTMTLDAGRIRTFALPHALENINGVVRFDSRGLGLDGVTARLGGGDVAFGGRVGIDGYRPGRIDVTMAGRNMRLRFPEGMRSLVDADLALTGTVTAATLSGDVQVRSALFTRRFDAAGGILDLTGVGAASSSSQPALALRYDVRINAPSTLRIENNTARGTASADVQLAGTYDRPLLFGQAEIERGEVLFEGRRYLITRGTIDFNNPTKIEPFFDIEAESRVRVPGQTYRVTVSAAGTIDRLTPRFDSDPPLPEIEAIALLLGDVSPGQDVELSQYSTAITPQQQLLRERAARALTGTLSAQVGRVVEQTFRVDTFQLTPSIGELYQQSSRVSPGARVTIGKRLSDRVYLTYSRSLVSTTRDQITLLEYDQSSRFSWVLSQNEDDTYALDVRVRHAF